MRKFADKEQAIKQVNGSNTEATLILYGYSRELANTNFREILRAETINIGEEMRAIMS